MIKIFSPNNKNACNRPFSLFANALSILFNDNKMGAKVIKNIREAKSEDIIFYFTGHLINDEYVNALSMITQRVIVYNSEALGRYKELLGFITCNKNILFNLDYYSSNVETIKSLGCASHCCPPVFHESYINNNLSPKEINDKTIDVLFYGSVSERRKKILDELIASGVNVIYVNSFTSQHEFESHIVNSKLVLIISYLENHRPIDYFRLNVLLSNMVFVIHEEIDTSQIEERDLHCNKIIYCEYRKIVQTCIHYLGKSSQKLCEYTKEAHSEFKYNRLESRFPIEKFKKLILNE